MKIVISSGHGLYVRGASGLIDEVDEARKVVPEVVKLFRAAGHQASEFHDNTSTTQDENLKTIVAFHNAQDRDLDVSVHFNAYVPTDGGRGTEVLYVSEDVLAAELAAAISRVSGLINRGGHYRSDLYFLNKTDRPAILIEVCFVDAGADVEQYQGAFTAICEAIASTIAGENEPAPPIELTGKVSWFGGPEDMGVAPDEPLAFIDEVADQPSIFLPAQPPDTTGLARRLDPASFYLATRWNYNDTPQHELLSRMALVRSPATGKEFLAFPADWGPHQNTGRIADISPGLMAALGIETDDVVEVIFPAPRPLAAG